jgi:hypothetical protein
MPAPPAQPCSGGGLEGSCRGSPPMCCPGNDLRLLDPFSRNPLSGMISRSSLETPEPGPRYLFSMIGNRTLMQVVKVGPDPPARPR